VEYPYRDHVYAERARALSRMVAVLAAALHCVACQRTSIDGLSVRAEPTTAAAVVGTIVDDGTRVEIECWTRGAAVRGDTVWFRIGAPVAGYVTNYYVETTGDVLAAEDPC
jgi:uncharacterized protein YraI